MNAIVSGGTGFIGRNMIRKLCENGYVVYAVVRPDSTHLASLPKHPNVHPVFCRLDEIDRALSELSIPCDVFYHFAWGGVNRDEIDSEAVNENNLRNSVNVLKAAIDIGCSCFIDAGSRVEYGIQDGPFSEDLTCHPIIAYGRAKLEFCNRASELCHNTDTRFFHTRIFSVYGPDDHPWSLIYTAVTKMLKNEPMELSSCTQRWNFMDVRDTVDLLLTLYEKRNRVPKDDNGIFNVATSDIRPLREFVEEIYKITHSQSELRFGAFHQGAESALSILPDMTKANKYFDWEARIGFADGIEYLISKLGREYA